MTLVQKNHVPISNIICMHSCLDCISLMHGRNNYPLLSVYSVEERYFGLKCQGDVYYIYY